MENASNLLPPCDPLHYDGWADTSRYSYEVSVPRSRKSEVFKIMQQDLARYFPYEAEMVKRRSQCLVLRRITQWVALDSKGGIPVEEGGPNGGLFQNVLVGTLVSALNKKYQRLLPPIIIKPVCRRP